MGSMPDVKIRRLPEWVVAAFRTRAECSGRSLEEELRVLLTDAASRPRQERAAEMEAFRKMLRRKYGTLSDSTDGIRADREARG
jgi:plasmid stability protein